MEMEKTRLAVLLDVLKVNESVVQTRNTLMGIVEKVDANSTEFIVVEGDQNKYYDVLKADELDSRAEEVILECFSEEEIEENYGRDEEGNFDLSTADINTYMELVAEQDGYSIYTPQG